jgi:hypothetical protein
VQVEKSPQNGCKTSFLSACAKIKGLHLTTLGVGAAALFLCEVVFTWFRLARESAGEEELLVLDRVRDTEEKLGKLTCISRYHFTVVLVTKHSLYQQQKDFA